MTFFEKMAPSMSFGLFLVGFSTTGCMLCLTVPYMVATKIKGQKVIEGVVFLEKFTSMTPLKILFSMTCHEFWIIL